MVKKLTAACTPTKVREKYICMSIMTHLSSPERITAMVFYSILTFFVGPLITQRFLHKHPDQCIAGFTLGFALSILLWTRFGYFLP